LQSAIDLTGAARLGFADSSRREGELKLTRCAAAVTAVALVVPGCGSNGPGSPSEVRIQVAGDYDIRKSVVSDACEGQTGQTSNPGRVSHAPGASAFTLNDHGTRDLPGTVNRDGTFSLRPFDGVANMTIPARDTFEGGRFIPTGFEVRVTTVLQTSPAPCTVVTQWSATKLGPPNVIP
jgi:hypothetical protein